MSQGRVVLTGKLFALGARRVRGPAQKQALLAAIEEAVWDLPSALFEGAGDDEWEVRVVASPEAQSVLEKAVARATA